MVTKKQLMAKINCLKYQVEFMQGVIMQMGDRLTETQNIVQDILTREAQRDQNEWQKDIDKRKKKENK